MQRADFVFQIYFEKMELFENVKSDFVISYKLFSLPTIEVDRLNSPPGTIEINQGKRMMLKIPQTEVVDSCPLEISIRAPRAGHTSVRLSQDKIKLQNNFEQALQNPNRYVQQKFEHQLKGKRDDYFAAITFSVSLCYTSSTMTENEGSPPIILGTMKDQDDKMNKTKTKSIKKSTKMTIDRSKSKRAPLIPEIPETRSRSIFYFDKGDLLEENRILAEEISRLTELVGRLREIVDQYEVSESSTRRTQTGNTWKPQQNGQRTDFIYKPAGLRPNRRTVH